MDDAIERFSKGGSELLLVENGQWSGASGQLVANPKSEIQHPQSIVLGRMAVGVIVHPKNILDSLPLGELQSIYCREITQWPAANGVAGTMHVFGLQHSDPMTQLLKEKLGGKTEKEFKYKAESDTAKVVLAVAKDPFAIGFVDLSQLSPDEKSVKLVDVYLPGQPRQAKTSTKDTKDVKTEDQGRKVGKTVNGSTPAARPSSLAAYSLSDDYPLARTFSLYVSPYASQAAKDFAEFATSPHCAEALAQHHLIPPLHTGSFLGDRETAKRDQPPKPQKPHLGNRR